MAHSATFIGLAVENRYAGSITTHLMLLLAALPVAALILLLILRVHAFLAVIFSILLALGMAPWFPVEAESFRTVAGSLFGVTIAVVFILLGGIIMSELLSVSGAQDRISDWLNRAVHSPDRAVLLLGLGVAPLAESIIGFGVGVIITVPLLMRLGLSATKSVSISLLGILIAPWGSLGPSLLIVAGMSGQTFVEIGTWTALFNLPVQLVMGGTMAVVGLGLRGALRMSGEFLVTTVFMWIALLAVNLWLTPALAGVIASVVGIMTLILLARMRGHRVPPMDSATRQSFLPYAFVIASLMLATLLTSVLDLGAAEGVVTSPALWLMVTALVTPFILKIPSATVGYCVRRGARGWAVVASISVLFITFGGLLTANGMSETLALGAAQLGSGFLVLLPAVSFLGGYVTASGSATAAMLTQGIVQTSTVLGANAGAMLGVQNSVTASAIMLSPSRFMLAMGVGRAQAAGSKTAPPEIGLVVRPLLAAGAILLAVYTVIVPLVISGLGAPH